MYLQGLTMAPLWLFAAVSALVVTSVFSQRPEDAFGAPPPLPETGVRLFLGVHNTTLPNYGMIAARDFAERDGGAGMSFIGLLDGLNDGLWCQSANGSDNIGSWKFPDGSDVSDDLNAEPIHMAHNRSQVGLLRTGSIGDVQGMYTCTIPDENGITQTLVVWTAGNIAYDGVPDPITGPETVFDLPNQSRANDPPVFTLSFDVMIAPPTYVTCQVGSTPVDVAQLYREVTSGEYTLSDTSSPVTSVTVALMTRQAGDYTCTVSVFRQDEDNLSDVTSPTVSVSVTDTPLSLSANRTGLLTANLSWMAPASNTPPVEGYEVFYMYENEPVSAGNTTASQVSLSLSSLEPDVNYTAFVVAYGGDLPSDRSETTIPAVVKIDFTTNGSPEAGSEFIITANVIICDEKLPIQMVNLVWKNSSGSVLVSNTENESSGMLLNPCHPSGCSLDLVFDPLLLSDVDCDIFVVTITENEHDIVTLNRIYLLMVQVPSPNVSVATPGSGLEGGNLALIGTVILPEAVDISTTIIATWRNGSEVVMNSSATPIAVNQMDMNTYVVTLTISSLSVAHNGNTYRLSVVVYPLVENDLQLIQPSNAAESNQVTIAVTDLSVTPIISGDTVVGSTNFSLTCTLDLSVEIMLSYITLQLVDFNNVSLASTNNLIEANSGIVFMPSVLNASSAGQYLCVAMVQDTEGNTGVDSTIIDVIIGIGSLSVAINESVGTVSGRYFASTPLSLTCFVTIPGAVDVSEFTVIESWTGPGGPIMSNDTNDRYNITAAVQAEDNNTYVTTLAIESLTYSGPNSDSGIYSCNLTLTLLGHYPYIQPQTGSGVGQFDLTVEEAPTPILNIVPVGLPQTGNDFSLVCNVSTDEDLISDLSVDWFRSGSEVVMNTSTRIIFSQTGTSFKVVTLMFVGAVMDDEGNYTCSSMLIVPGSLGPPLVASGTISVGQIGPPVVNIMDLGSNVAGEQYSLVCKVTVEAGTATAMWIHNGEEVTEGITSTGQGTTTVQHTLQFNPLTYQDGGTYTCVGTSTVSNPNMINSSMDVNIQVPAPEVDLKTDSSGTLYQATQQSLTCTVTFTNFLHVPPDGITVSFLWYLRELLIQNDTRVTISYQHITLVPNSTLASSSLTFSPINTTDSGNYTCSVHFSVGESPDNINGPQDKQASVDINVEDFPVPNIAITPMGDNTAGNNFTLTCTAEDVVDNLLGMPELQWVISETLLSSNTSSLDLIFNPLRTSDGGVFVCRWIFSAVGINFDQQNSFVLNVTIPTSSVSVQTLPSGVTLYVGTYIDVICAPSITVAVDTEVSISFTWTAHDGDGQSIDIGGDGYTTTDQLNSSTLRIEQLTSVDNMVVYSCLVNVTPASESVYIMGSEPSMNSITLNVLDLAAATFAHEVFIPGTPTAGDNFTIECIVTEPKRLVIMPRLTWEVEIDGEPPVEVNSTEAAAIQSGVTIEDTVATGKGVFSRALSFTSIRTSHARKYTCEVFISGVVSEGEFGDLKIQIPPPAVTITVSPAVDPIYSSTAINLICTAVLAEEVDTATIAMATWTGPTDSNDGQGEQPTDPNRISVMSAVSLGERMFESVLLFNPVDSKEDNGLHTCEMTIISNTGFSLEDSLINDGNNTGESDVVVGALPDEIPIITVTASGSGEVGQPFNLSCNVTLVERMVVSLGTDYNISWIKIDSVSEGEIGKDINIPTVTVVGDPTTTVTLIFDPLRFQDRGTYTCMAEFNVTTTFDAGDESVEIDIIVDFPPVGVEVSMDYGDPLYAGTNLILTCFIDLDEDLVDIPVDLSTSWTRNSVTVTTDSTHLEEQPSLLDSTLLMYAATYAFTPLDDRFDSTDMGDSGTYQCDLTVTPTVTDNFVRPRMGSDTHNITVVAIPAPTVDIVVNGTGTPGQALCLTCVVGVVDRLVVQPEIVWEKYASNESAFANSISIEPSRDGNNSTLCFPSLLTSDAGLYTCRANITIDSIGFNFTDEDTQNITLQIPPPSLMLTQSRNGMVQLAGSSLTFTIDILVDSAVNTPHSVGVIWARSETDLTNLMYLTTEERITLSDVTSKSGFNQYRAQLMFSTLSSLIDSGVYTSGVTVNSSSSYPYVIHALPTTEMVDITVFDPTLTVFEEEDFVGVETGCIHSNLFDKVTLICNATKPEEVIPELTVTWLHNGNVRSEGSIQFLNGNATVIDTLSFNSSAANDSGNYTCVAQILIPESRTVIESITIDVIFRSARAPFSPEQVQSTVTTTTANISWTVPEIAYTPENYIVTYYGLELQPETRESQTIFGNPTDILATNRMYSVLLEALEEANTYNFIVNATNCNGTTSTNVMNFTTDPDSPKGEPRNCINNTFNARNIGLQWEEPVRALQNGQITGYNLTCVAYSVYDFCTNFSADLSSTQNSNATSFTIDPVSPFTEYNCSLSAINDEGEGPPTQCIFTTEQDAPDGEPENLTDTRNIHNVTFEWFPPSCPNGVIQQYLFSINTSDNATTRSLCANQTSMTVDGFEPYEYYSVEVIASTVVNGEFADSPPAMLAGFSLPDRSSPVLELRVISINSTTFNINFLPPSAPNGIISSYEIDVHNTLTMPENFTDIVDNGGTTDKVFTTTMEKLSMCVPYYITVYAVNQVGRGLGMEDIAFTKSCRPDVAPDNVQVVVVDLSIRVSWNPVSLEEAQGFFMYRIIFRLITTASVKRNGRQVDTPMDFFVDVPSDQTSYTVTSEDGYDPNSPYNVFVALAVDDGSGTPFPDPPTSEPQAIDPLVTPAPAPDNTLIYIIVAVVVGVLIIIAIAVGFVITCLLLRKSKKHGGITLERNGRRKRKDLYDTRIEMSPVTVKPLDEPPVDYFHGASDTQLLRTAEETAVSETNDQHEEEEETKQDLAAATERRMDEELMLERMKPISKISFHEHVTKMHLDSDKGFEEEYKSVPMETDSSSEVGHLEMNKLKNRFANIFPYDSTRIRLKQLDDAPGSDYINACYSDGFNRTDCYIAAQGPLPTTVGDFWRMIWESRVTNVVMLTGVVEAGKKKCEQYWPDKVGENLSTQNRISVMLTSFVPFSDYIIRSLRVTKPDDGSAQPLDVTQYHFTAWPDHGVPQFATSLITFIRRVQKAHNKDKGIPLLVHCSAGVGRTGTFIMLDTMMDRLKVEDTVNVYEFLRSLRAKRMHMVQTQVQYVFIHDALDELITCGETDISASNLRAKVNRMHKIVPGKNITGFQEQFQLLEQVCYKPSESAFSDALQPYNAPKNRYGDKLPLNLTRPRLRPTGASGSDYINASFVDGYKMRNAYITTQGPLKSTVDDFWRMVWEFKSRNIVMLCKNVEEGEEKCYMYWPTQENEPVEYGKLKVTLQAEIPGDEFITRKIHICNDKGTKVDKEGAMVTLFQYMTWSVHGHPSSSAHMIELVETLTRAQMNTGNRPITVMCNDGVGRSGAFICIHSQLDRLKTDADVDVFKYLKTARTRRQGLIIELDHYVYCHEVLADYVEAFDPYANFKNL